MKSLIRIMFLSSMMCGLVYAAGEIAASAQPPAAMQPPVAVQSLTVAQPPVSAVNESTGILPAAMDQVPTSVTPETKPVVVAPAVVTPAPIPAPVVLETKLVEPAPVVPTPVVAPVSASATPEIKPAEPAAVAPVTTPASVVPETKPVELAPVVPASMPAPVVTETKSVESAPVVSTPEDKAVISAPAQDLTTSASPSADREKEVISQTIEDLASRSKILSPAPDITEQTQPSKELQDERAQAVPVPVPVDNKKFAAEKMQLDLELVPPECVPSTLDTTDADSGGNWVIKRAFWEQAERTYEKIMQSNNAIYEQHMALVKMRKDINDISDKALMDLGFKEGELDTVLARILEEIKTQQETQGTLTEPERQLKQTLKDKQQELEQLKLNLQVIDELDNALDQAMLSLNKQVTACRQYEKQSWDRFKAIGRELNDKKARLLFYEIEGFFKTVEKNREYISGELRKYFDDTIGSINTKIDELRTKLNELKQKGTDLNAEMERFAKADRDKLQQGLGAEKDQLEKERAELARQQALEKEVHKSWFVRVKDATKHAADYALDWMMRGFALVKRLIGIK